MRILVGIIAVLAFAVSGSVASYAKSYKGYKGHKRHPDAYRYVYAESQNNPTKHITAPVRHARLGDQVLVPDRGWTYCEYTCVYTLQKEYLDFWEYMEDEGNVSPGMLGDLLRHLRDY